jgi:hypothetical protein
LGLITIFKKFFVGTTAPTKFTVDPPLVVEWCDQLKVLAHPSTGCFVTHCGWNSTLEALVFGVPMVAVPNWSDQPVNARLVEELGVGVRAERDAAGLLVGTELASCIAVVTGDGDEGMSIRNRASSLKKGSDRKWPYGIQTTKVR